MFLQDVSCKPPQSIRIDKFQLFTSKGAIWNSYLYFLNENIGQEYYSIYFKNIVLASWRTAWSLACILLNCLDITEVILCLSWFPSSHAVAWRAFISIWWRQTGQQVLISKSSAALWMYGVQSFSLCLYISIAFIVYRWVQHWPKTTWNEVNNYIIRSQFIFSLCSMHILYPWFDLCLMFGLKLQLV